MSNSPRHSQGSQSTRSSGKSERSTSSRTCIFCKIIEKTEAAQIIFENDEILIFKDIKPAALFHFLSVPKEHIPNVNSLTGDNTELLETLIAHGRNILEQQGGDKDDSIFGFHMPPFNTVGHLHLHVISPASSLSFLQRFMFRPNTWWFSTADQILRKLKKEGEEEEESEDMIINKL